MSQQDVVNIVDPIAQSYQVPTKLWETVVQQESGFNPRSIGDNGTSFGLFQLHIGGQADRALNQGYTTNDLLDPAINAKFGLPSIASAWNSLKSSFDPNSTTWWTRFAVASGHPGGYPGNPATEAEARALQGIYTKGKPLPPVNSPGDIVTQVQTDTGNAVSGAVNGAISSSISGFLSGLAGDFAKVGLFLVAIVLIIVGFLVIGSGSK